MKIPLWLLSRPALYAGGILLALAAVGLWFRAHDARVRREEAARVRIEQLEIARIRQDSTIIATQDSLSEARANVDTVVAAASAGVASYAQQRARISTTAPQPASTPPGMVVVPVSFVAAADSLAALVPQLVAQMAAERLASERRIVAVDSAYALARAEIVQLQIAVKAAKPGLSGKVKYAAIGGGIVAVGLALLGAK